jgi:hypothetical protein
LAKKNGDRDVQILLLFIFFIAYGGTKVTVACDTFSGGQKAIVVLQEEKNKLLKRDAVLQEEV